MLEIKGKTKKTSGTIAHEQNVSNKKNVVFSVYSNNPLPEEEKRRLKEYFEELTPKHLPSVDGSVVIFSIGGECNCSE